MTRVLRLVLLAAIAVAATLVAGCGNKEEVRTVGQTEGLYIDIGELKYQVQISRELNPGDVEDRSYLLGLPEGVAPTGKETWFAIFMRVQNTTSEKTLPTAEQFSIVDTTGREYTPVPLDEKSNPFAYRPARLGPEDILPTPDSAAGTGPIQGSLLLFKVTIESLGNRPLELRIVSPENPSEVGIVDLDV